MTTIAPSVAGDDTRYQAAHWLKTDESNKKASNDGADNASAISVSGHSPSLS